jgi:hypothetical protein
MQPLKNKERTILLTALGIKNAKGLNEGRVKYIRKKSTPQHAVSYRMKKPEVPSTHSRPIRCVDTGEVFPSQIAAALAHGTRPSNLSDHLKGKSITVGGRTYEYVDDATGIDKPKRNTSKRRVRCVDTGEEFESMTKAATAHNISTNGLSLHLRGVQSNVGGKRYEYV